MSSLRRLALLFALAPLAACAEYDLANASEDGAQAGDSDEEYDDMDTGDYDEDFLRLDVYPSTAEVPLDQQSVALDSLGDQGTIRLDPTITISGVVLGFDSDPAIDAEVPGEADVPVEAVVRAELPGLITGAASLSDEDGRFELSLPDSGDYLFSVVPDSVDFPIYVELGRDFTDGEDLAIALGATEEDGDGVGPGEPVFGLVRQADGSTIGGLDATVRLIDPESGVAGPRVEVEDDGHFLLRALPGSWLVQLEGEAGGWLPTQLAGVTVESGSSSRVDFDTGLLEPVYVSGEVHDADGDELDEVLVRLTALSLEDAEGSLVVEWETANGGKWRPQLLPGEWRAEFIPPFDPDGRSAPTSSIIVVESGGSVDLPDTELPDRVDLTFEVVDSSGAPVPYVVVSAREEGFDRYLYTATTDQSGAVSMSLPPVALGLRLTPPTAEVAITHYTLDNPAAVTSGAVELQLSQGELVEGRLVAGDAAVPFAYVEILDNYDEVYATALTDDNGAFSVRIDPSGLSR